MDVQTSVSDALFVPIERKKIASHDVTDDTEFIHARISFAAS